MNEEIEYRTALAVIEDQGLFRALTEVDHAAAKLIAEVNGDGDPFMAWAEQGCVVHRLRALELPELYAAVEVGGRLARFVPQCSIMNATLSEACDIAYRAVQGRGLPPEEVLRWLFRILGDPELWRDHDGTVLTRAQARRLIIERDELRRTMTALESGVQ